MRQAAAAEDFDEAKRLKLRIEALRRDRASRAMVVEARAPVQSAAPAALLPIITRQPPVAQQHPGAARSRPGAYPGCLVKAWDSVWLVHPNGTRSFVTSPTDECKARATMSEVSEITKNEGPGLTYLLSEAHVIALACANRGCPTGPIARPSRSTGVIMDEDDGRCVLSALRATPLPPIDPQVEQREDEHVLSAELIGKYASPHRQIIVTFVNSHYLQFALTWVHHLRRVGCNHFLVGAMDPTARASPSAPRPPRLALRASPSRRSPPRRHARAPSAALRRIARALS
jgi:hypothetical protein